MANDIFVKIDDLLGDSQDGTHLNEISVLGWSWGMSQTGTTHLGPGGGSGKVSVNDIVFQKRIDTSSTNLYNACAKGKHFKTAVFTMRKAGTTNPVEFFKISLDEIIISSISTSVAPESETVIESISLNFAKYKLSYTGQDGAGEAMAEMPASWDIPKNDFQA